MKYFVLFGTFVSSIAFADFNMNQSDAPFKFVKPPKAGEEECVLKTMPKTRSQDGLAICFSSVAASLVDEYSCYKKNNTKCAEVPDSEKMSQLDMARFSKIIDDYDERGYRDNYQGLVIGGSTYRVLLSVWHADSIVSEACAPLDKVIIGTEDTAGAQEALWKKFEKYFLESKGPCPTCSATVTAKSPTEVKQEFQLHQTPQEITKAMAQDTWEKALDQLLIPEKCRDWQTMLSTSQGMDRPKFFPENDKTSDQAGYLAKIQEITCGKKRPIGINFCTGDLKKFKSSKECSAAGLAHAVIIEGYRELCTTRDFTKCVPQVKIRNSWGEGWQRQNNDGWVSAKTLLNATYYDNQPMTWLEKRPPTQY